MNRLRSIFSVSNRYFLFLSFLLFLSVEYFSLLLLVWRACRFRLFRPGRTPIGLFDLGLVSLSGSPSGDGLSMIVFVLLLLVRRYSCAGLAAGDDGLPGVICAYKAIKQSPFSPCPGRSSFSAPVSTPILSMGSRM